MNYTFISSALFLRPALATNTRAPQVGGLPRPPVAASSARGKMSVVSGGLPAQRVGGNRVSLNTGGRLAPEWPSDYAPKLYPVGVNLVLLEIPRTAHVLGPRFHPAQRQAAATCDAWLGAYVWRDPSGDTVTIISGLNKLILYSSTVSQRYRRV